MKIPRRELLGLTGGAAVGVMFTPVPWKLVHDSALWSQSWPGVPVPMRGATSVKYTTCPLCPAACGVRATCVGGQPVQLAGVPSHPQSRGMLCTAGLVGHHLPFHAERLRAPFRRVRDGADVRRIPATSDEAMSAWKQVIGSLKPGEHVAILDQRPGRAQSFLYRRMLNEVPQGIYLTMSDQGATLESVRQCVAPSAGPFGLDLENTGTLLSFGAPVVDGWGTPGRVLALRKQGRLRIVQVEPIRSRTADRADLWVPITPGSEVAFTLSIAHVLIAEKLTPESQSPALEPLRKMAAQFSPEIARTLTGIAPDLTVAVAKELVANGTAVAIGGGDPGGGPLGAQEEAAIAGLNLLLGNVGRPGGIVERRETPVPAEWAKAPMAPSMDLSKVPDNSIRALITDPLPSGNAIPRRLLEKKLAQHATVIRFSPFVPAYGFDGEFVIPTAAYPNALDEIATPFDSPRAMFAVAAPIQPADASSLDPLELLGAGKTEDAVKARAQAIFESGRGELFNYASGETAPLKSLKNGEEFWTQLTAGACWRDSESTAAPHANVRMPEGFLNASQGRLQRTPEYPLALLPSGWRAAVGGNKLSPLLSKVYEESGLRDSPSVATISPQSAEAFHLTEGCRAMIETACGGAQVKVRVDSSVMPGVVQVAVGPERAGLLETCAVGADCTWRISAARMVKL